MDMDMCRQHLKNIVEKLLLFEKSPKEVEGKIIKDFFKIGERIFVELYYVGTCIKWDYTVIKKQKEVSDVVINVIKNQEWLQTFINIYPSLRIDLDLIGSAGDICKVRSGIEVLLKGFINIDAQFNRVLTNLEQLGEVDEFDRCLKIWRNTGHRPDFDSCDKQSAAPKNHWWWY
ncbi:unnamed protein product, partial [Brenthis ino]